MSHGIGSRRTAAVRLGWWGFGFAALPLAYIVAFQLYPILFSFYISLHKYDLVSPPHYVGFANFARLPTDRAFLSSVAITLAYVAYTIVPVLGMAFGLGYALTLAGRSRGVWRILLFVPSVLPVVSVALVWKLLFNMQGPINAAVVAAGGSPVPWLNSSAWAPWALVVMSWWHATSYYTIIFLTGFLAIPRDYYEAASLDGASGWNAMREITLPLMRPTIALAVVLATVNGLKTFAFQQIVTDGGPAGATQILTLLIYKTSFNYLDVGRASAYSVVLFVAILLISVAQLLVLGGRRG